MNRKTSKRQNGTTHAIRVFPQSWEKIVKSPKSKQRALTAVTIKIEWLKTLDRLVTDVSVAEKTGQ